MTNDLYLTKVALEKESRAMTIQRFESDLPDKNKISKKLAPNTASL